MIKKLALIAAAVVICSAVPAVAPASAQGVSVQIGNGGDRDRDRDRGYRGYREHRGDRDFRRGRAKFVVRRDRGHHRGWERRHGNRTVVIER